MDIIINASGSLRWLTYNMNWEYQQQFKVAPMKPYKLKSRGIVGYIKNFGNLYYVTVNKAGHMIPAYQIDVSMHSINCFINQKQDFNE